MCLPVNIRSRTQTVPTTALIDSGAEGQFIDSDFVKKHDIPTLPLPQPIPVRNVDFSPNHSGPITHCAWRNIFCEGKRTWTKLLVTSLGKQSIILGLPWLRRHNPKID